MPYCLRRFCTEQMSAMSVDCEDGESYSMGSFGRQSGPAYPTHTRSMLKVPREKELCQALVRSMEWTWLGHAILSPGWRITFRGVARCLLQKERYIPRYT